MIQQRKLQNKLQETPRKENMISLNVNLPSLNLCQKAESVEVLDKGPTINIFTIYFF